jgi:hypothetical protein
MRGYRRALEVVIVAVLSVTAMFSCGPKSPQVMNNASKEQPPMNDSGSPIHLISFAEQPAAKGQPILLQVHIINESQSPLAILNDLDSINIPKDPPGSGIAPNTDLTHVDFGASGAGQFVKVGPGESVKVTLILTDSQLAQLERVKAVKVPVKFRDGNNDQAEVKTLLLQSKVYKAYGA